MKKIYLLAFISISISLFSCNNNNNNSKQTENNQKNSGTKESSGWDGETPRVSISSIKPTALILNMENEIYINISTVKPEHMKIVVREGTHYDYSEKQKQEGETIIGNGKGLFIVKPTKIGKITINVVVDNNGRDEAYGTSVFNVVSSETSIGEIYNME